MANFVRIKDTQGIPAHSIVCTVRPGYSSSAPSTKNKRKQKPYDTPKELGVKRQMNVKYVPTACYSGPVPQKFYQYTIIDEHPGKDLSILTWSKVATLRQTS